MNWEKTMTQGGTQKQLRQLGTSRPSRLRSRLIGFNYSRSMTLWFNAVSIRILTNVLLQLFKDLANNARIQDSIRQMIQVKERHSKAKTKLFSTSKPAAVSKVQCGTLSSRWPLINSQMNPPSF